ncbi:aldolase, partial [Rhizobium sp. PDO1-076]|uniref:aldolase n=1 Tax=Rhizobium sp. PDO1-076 TaxID=1125979 RepID=UPI0005601463
NGVNFARRNTAGDGVPEATAFYIHARLHKMSPPVGAAFHSHMPNATALGMVEGEPLLWAGQTALKFYGRVAVDENYHGLALDESEGDRIASVLGDKAILFMKNHGVMVCAPNIAEAWDNLYYLERAAEVQLKAMSSGRKLLPVLPDVTAEAARQMRERDPESARMHLQSIRRVLDRQTPGYRD